MNRYLNSRSRKKMRPLGGGARRKQRQQPFNLFYLPQRPQRTQRGDRCSRHEQFLPSLCSCRSLEEVQYPSYPLVPFSAPSAFPAGDNIIVAPLLLSVPPSAPTTRSTVPRPYVTLERFGGVVNERVSGVIEEEADAEDGEIGGAQCGGVILFLDLRQRILGRDGLFTLHL